ncbi:hypothetical protein ACFO0F_33485, partial [Nonomuraea zeae]
RQAAIGGLPFSLEVFIPSLVPIARFAAATGATLEPAEEAKAQILLEDVSALVTAYCGRDFAWHSNELVTLPVDWCRVTWPNRLKPVSTVHSVSVDGEPYTDYSVTLAGLVLTGRPTAEVDVTISYGYHQVPGDVQAVVLSESLYKFNAEPGISQEQIGDLLTDFSMSVPTLSRDAKRSLRRYRPMVRTVAL